MTDPDLAATIRAARKASESIELLRDMVWTLQAKDPGYGLIVQNGLRSVSKELFRAALPLDAGLDMLVDLETIANSRIA